jgi:pimeloyl-ACP methyl ester carboxylesterase
MQNENELHFTDVGEGEVALVFLHYFGGSLNEWNKVIAELSPQYRCIAIDLPGFGNSPELKILSVSNCAEEVAQVISLLALKQYVLIGHSMGGKIALSLAALQPSALTSLILIAPSPPTPEPIDDKEQTQLLNAYGDPFALQTLLNHVVAQPLAIDDMENAVADNMQVSYAAWNWWILHGSREDISHQKSAVSVPVLIISGAMDPKFSSSFLKREMIKYFSSATFIEIPEAGHLIPIELPLTVANAIEKFIEKEQTCN